MHRDTYLKVILTVLAFELLWLGLKETAPPVSAQAAPMRVVITGIELEQADHDYLPVGVAGGFRQMPPRYLADLEPVEVRILGTVPIEARAPLKIEADRPLPVEAVPYTPGARPGD